MMKKIAFTICSNNYLAQAKILGDSLCALNPDYRFIIGLVDKKNADINYSFFEPHTIIEVADISVPDFDSLWKKYAIIELNTSVKPSFFKYLLKTFPEATAYFYFDPDIMCFNTLKALEKELQAADILLTPHIFTPIPLDGKIPQENVFLNYGIYNLGFIGLRKNQNTQAFLDWWEERTLKNGHIDVARGIFVDQLYINHVPLFFEKVKILREYGYNAAPWNLHERREIQKTDIHYIMKDGSELVFYHFSSFSYLNPEKLSKIYDRYSFGNCPDLIPLYEEYLARLKQNNIALFSVAPCWYVTEREKIIQEKIREKEALIRKQKNTFKSISVRIVKQVCPPFLYNSMRKLYYGSRG